MSVQEHQDRIDPTEDQLARTIDRIFNDACFRNLMQTDPIAALTVDGWVLTPEQQKAIKSAGSIDPILDNPDFVAIPRIRPAVQVITRTRTTTRPAVRIVTRGTRPVVRVVVQTAVPVPASITEYGPDPLLGPCSTGSKLTPSTQPDPCQSEHQAVNPGSKPTPSTQPDPYESEHQAATPDHEQPGEAT